MDVSIIIVNYNTFELTCNCIESILSHEANLNFEIILVDNNSTEIPALEFKKKFANVVLIESPINIGFAKGNNLGIALSKGKCILLLNSDTILVNDAISKSMNFLVKQPKVGVVTARLEYKDGRVQHNCQRFPSPFYQLFEFFRIQKILGKRLGGRILLGPFFDHQSAVYPDWVWGTFFMFRKDSLELLPEKKLADNFFMYVEDMQWCMDFHLAGFKVAFLPEAKVLHLMGMSNGPKNEMMKQNEEEFMRLYYSAFTRGVIKILASLLKFRLT